VRRLVGAFVIEVHCARTQSADKSALQDVI